MLQQNSEKILTKCPECGAENEVLYLPSTKTKVEVAGARAGRSIKWTGNSERVEGKCGSCNYKFKLEDL